MKRDNIPVAKKKLRNFIVSLLSTFLLVQTESVFPQKSADSVNTSVNISEAYFPEYPTLAAIAGVSGTVKLEVNLDAEGNVSKIQNIYGHPLLNQQAEECIKLWKFSKEANPKSFSITFIFTLLPKDSTQKGNMVIFKPPSTVEIKGISPKFLQAKNVDPPLIKKAKQTSKKTKTTTKK